MANKKNQTLCELYGENYYCSICDKYFQDMSGLGRHYHTKQHLKNKDRNPTYVELTMETINFIPFTCECGIVLLHENRVTHRNSKLHKSNMSSKKQTVVEEVKQCKKTNIYITPISTTPISTTKERKEHFSKRDFELQMENLNKGITKIYWDGPPPKKTKKQPKIGDYFIFWHHKKFINIHKIQNVFSPICRLPEWSDNVGHSDRLVVELSCNYEQIKWKDYINKFDGYPNCWGTTRISEERSTKIIEFLTQEF